MMTLPNFICVGTQKAATTYLYSILKQHPDIFIPRIKETHFFDDDEQYAKGINWYESEFFSRHVNERAVGEITPSYMFIEKVPEKIFKNLGSKTKLIFIYRNPAKRAYSHYLMNRYRGHEEEEFNRAVELEQMRVNSGFMSMLRYSYISRGLYAVQTERFLKHFPYKNMLFLVYEEDIMKNMDITIKRVFDFLNVRNMDLHIDLKSNPASVPRSLFIRDFIYKPSSLKAITGKLIPFKWLRNALMSFLDRVNRRAEFYIKLKDEVEKDIIYKYFLDDIHKLEDIIQRDLKVWYDHTGDWENETY